MAWKTLKAKPNSFNVGKLDLDWIRIQYNNHEYRAAKVNVNLFGRTTMAVAVMRDDADKWMSTRDDCVAKLVSWRLPKQDAKELVDEAWGKS